MQIEVREILHIDKLVHFWFSMILGYRGASTEKAQKPCSPQRKTKLGNERLRESRTLRIHVYHRQKQL